MDMTREKQKQEALERMRMLKIIPDAIKQFKDDDVVMRSEGGFLFSLNEKEKEIVKEFEKEYDGLVYMVIQNLTEFGMLYSMLYVNKHEHEWEMDREDINEGFAVACIHNVNGPAEFEIGSIEIQNRFGGVVRVS